MTICVYGAASVRIAPAHIEAGERLGGLLAAEGYPLIYGAGATGLMGAVSRGAARAGGHVTGVVPKFFTNQEVLNTECDELIRPDTMRQRKQIMDERASAFIVTPGGVGTFEEFFEVLTLKQLDQHVKPIIIMNTLGYYEPMLEMLRHAVKTGFLNPTALDLFTVVDTPEQAIQALKSFNITP